MKRILSEKTVKKINRYVSRYANMYKVSNREARKHAVVRDTIQEYIKQDKGDKGHGKNNSGILSICVSVMLCVMLYF